jgi:hypothetical protein
MSVLKDPGGAMIVGLDQWGSGSGVQRISRTWAIIYLTAGLGSTEPTSNPRTKVNPDCKT